MTTQNTNWTEAAQALEAAKTILIVTHVSPDGDAIGSLTGLAAALREHDFTVTAAVDGGVSDYLAFLPGAKSVKSKLKKGDWDLMISVDASDEERIGKVGAYGMKHAKTVINLDHHPTNTLFGDIHLVVPDAVSATQIITQWLEKLQWQISQPVATALLTGLVTDTHAFRTSNVTPDTMRMATRLMEAGAPLPEIIFQTLNNKSFKIVNLWKQALESLFLEDQVIGAEIKRETFKTLGFSETTDGGLVEWLLSAREAMISVVFKELQGKKVEISFRCKPGYDVAEVAFGLGGGGHKQASGTTVKGTLEEVKAQVIPLLKEAAKKGKLAYDT